jgi:hypothetical protein
MKVIFRIAGKLEGWMLLCGTLVLFIIGSVINNYFPTHLFIFKFILLLGIFNILIFSAKHYNTFIINDFLRTSTDPVLNAEKLKLKNSVFANYNVFISVIVSLFFIAISVYLGFINFNITGYISLVVLFITIFISIIGYMLYVHLIRFLHRLSNADIEKYSKFYPAYTSWLVDITKYSSIYQNGFFISGTLYVILFTVHAPAATLKILSVWTVSNLQDIVLTASWLVIFLAVLIGFPITSYLKSRMIKSIVTKLKIKSSEYFESVMDKVKIDKQLDYIKIIKEIMESPDYPVKSGLNLAISTATLILNLIIAVQKFYPQLGK